MKGQPGALKIDAVPYPKHQTISKPASPQFGPPSLLRFSDLIPSRGCLDFNRSSNLALGVSSCSTSTRYD